MEKRIRVGIRGISGLLGSRLALAVARQPDMEVVVGIGKNDATLTRLIRLEQMLRKQGRTLAGTLCLDEPHAVVQSVNDQYRPIQFIAADQLALHKHCDIIVDATGPGVSKRYSEQYQSYRIPVILQSGEFPRGTLIAPPLSSMADGNLWRQGDCCLSGLMPVLALFKNEIVTGRINIVMQYSQILNDFPTDQRIQATYRRPDLTEQLEQQLSMLLGTAEFSVDVLQVPALDYYTASIALEMQRPFSGQELNARFQKNPRMCLANSSINSTNEIDHHLREPLRAMGADLAPIVVYGSSMKPVIGHQNTCIRFQVSFYSRLIAVLPNIDTIRMLARGVPAQEAMRITDQNLSITSTV